ncbi:MAG: hypothetical protein ABSE85_08815 [Candidatus Korobacteraceae bacterium]
MFPSASDPAIFVSNLTTAPMNSYRLYPILAFGATAAIIGYALLSRKNKKPAEDLERGRRSDLARGGRIIDGNVIDVLELEDDVTGQQMVLLVYTYDVAGVTYEASQDVTHLRQFIDLYSCRLGLPASVKYDPHNPGDSIVISETWSGLRKPTIVLPQPTVAKSVNLNVPFRPSIVSSLTNS